MDSDELRCEIARIVEHKDDVILKFYLGCIIKDKKHSNPKLSYFYTLYFFNLKKNVVFTFGTDSKPISPL